MHCLTHYLALDSSFCMTRSLSGRPSDRCGACATTFILLILTQISHQTANQTWSLGISVRCCLVLWTNRETAMLSQSDNPRIWRWEICIHIASLQILTVCWNQWKHERKGWWCRPSEWSVVVYCTSKPQAFVPVCSIHMQPLTSQPLWLIFLLRSVQTTLKHPCT